MSLRHVRRSFLTTYGFTCGPCIPLTLPEANAGRPENLAKPRKAILTAVRVLALPVLLLCGPALFAQEAREGFAERSPEHEGLVDEDEEYAPQEQVYAFNPVQARNELKVGNYYAKKGNHRAAVGRYLAATKWDSNFGEAYWRLGVARERLGQVEGALEAFVRYLDLEPHGKRARQARTRLAKLEATARRVASAADSE